MKIYLAGNYYTDWRDQLTTPGLFHNYQYPENEENVFQQWEEKQKAILGVYDYAGPFLLRDQSRPYPLVITNSLRNCDYVFVWIETQSDLYQIAHEASYGHALGKQVYVYIKANSEQEFVDFLNTLPADFYHMMVFIESSPAWWAISPKEAFKHFASEYISIFSLTLEQLINYASLCDKLGIKGRGFEYLPSKKFGYVYIIKAETGHFKIGCSKNVPDRMKLFAVKLPFKFEMVNYFPCWNMYLAERELHESYSDYRTNGEWFDLPLHEIDSLSKAKSHDGVELLDEQGDPIYYSEILF